MELLAAAIFAHVIFVAVFMSVTKGEGLAIVVAWLIMTAAVAVMLSGCGAKADPCCITYQDYTATMDAPAPTPAATIEASKYQFRP